MACTTPADASGVPIATCSASGSYDTNFNCGVSVALSSCGSSSTYPGETGTNYLDGAIYNFGGDWTTTRFLVASAGYDSKCVVTSDNRLLCGGENKYKQIPNTSAASVSTPLEYPTWNAIGDPAVKMDAHAYGYVIMTESGSLYTWGYNFKKELLLDVTDSVNFPTGSTTLVGKFTESVTSRRSSFLKL
eukprot:TRINITY_DN29612_c0_g1_i1.p2 TRINITY_DN29612_c0_g1~~TRINITY_DN29612_c0_g1_i1.p2  ORF type:complete len:207 (-),score=15.28 TRINITY_DN29612_c0_g1_i1:495-1061(-)